MQIFKKLLYNILAIQEKLLRAQLSKTIGVKNNSKKKRHYFGGCTIDLSTLAENEKQKLEEERDNLINVERPRVIEELQLARSQGDLSENADYDAARDKQAQIEQRIKEIEYMLQNAEIISEEQMDLNVVKPGTTVTILDLSLDDPEEEKYTIVGSFETDPVNGKISNESPLAKALIGHGVNEIVTVGVAEAYDVKIVDIEFTA